MYVLTCPFNEQVIAFFVDVVGVVKKRVRRTNAPQEENIDRRRKVTSKTLPNLRGLFANVELAGIIGLFSPSHFHPLFLPGLFHLQMTSLRFASHHPAVSLGLIDCRSRNPRLLYLRSAPPKLLQPLFCFREILSCPLVSTQLPSIPFNKTHLKKKRKQELTSRPPIPSLRAFHIAWRPNPHLSKIPHGIFCLREPCLRRLPRPQVGFRVVLAQNAFRARQVPSTKSQLALVFFLHRCFAVPHDARFGVLLKTELTLLVSLPELKL